MPNPVHLVLSNDTLRVNASLTDKQYRVLDRLFSFYLPNYNFMEIFRRGLFDGKKHFFSMSKQSLPAGFLPLLSDYFTENQVPYSIEDHRKPIKFPRVPSSQEWFDILKQSKFKPVLEKCRYQRDAILALKKCQVASIPFQRGIVSMGTGSGKTLTGGLLPLLFSNEHVLYTIFRKDIAYQTREAWQQLLGEEVGMIGDEIYDPRRVTIAMTQSLLSKIKRSHNSKNLLTMHLGKVRVWCADEVHRDEGSMFAPLSKIMINCPIRVGFSGSIMRKELNEHRLRDAEVHAVFGKKVYNLPTKILRDKGLLAEIIVKVIPFRSPSFRGRVKYHQVYTEGIAENYDRNSIIASLIKRFDEKKLPTLILCTRVAQCRMLQSLANGLGVKHVPVLTGKESSATRRYHLTRFKNGEFYPLIASTIFDIGLDLPEVERLILANAGKGGEDGSVLLQRVGRVMRAKRKKANIGIVYDFHDSDPHFLESHFRERLRIYAEEAFTVEHLPTSFNVNKAV